MNRRKCTCNVHHDDACCESLFDVNAAEYECWCKMRCCLLDFLSFMCLYYNRIIKSTFLPQCTKNCIQMAQINLLHHTRAKILDLTKNSHFGNLIFHKIHNFKHSFFTRFTVSKSHFSQNSHFSNIKILVIYG